SHPVGPVRPVERELHPHAVMCPSSPESPERANLLPSAARVNAGGGWFRGGWGGWGGAGVGWVLMQLCVDVLMGVLSVAMLLASVSDRVRQSWSTTKGQCQKAFGLKRMFSTGTAES